MITRKFIKKIVLKTTLPISIPIAIAKGRFVKHNICLFHSGRCGSTMIGDLLGKHPNIHWDGEIFPFLFLSSDKINIQRKAYDKTKTKNYLTDRMRGVVNSYYGFEAKLIHLEWLSISESEFIDTLIDLGFDTYIILERRNHLRTIISYTIGKVNGLWHIHSDKAVNNTPINIDVNNVFLEYEVLPLLKALDRMTFYYSTFREELKTREIDYIDIIYESDIENDPYIAYKKIINHIGLNPRRPRIRFKRTNPLPIKVIVSNYNELESTLAGTPYQWMLKD